METLLFFCQERFTITLYHWNGFSFAYFGLVVFFFIAENPPPWERNTTRTYGPPRAINLARGPIDCLWEPFSLFFSSFFCLFWVKSANTTLQKERAEAETPSLHNCLIYVYQALVACFGPCCGWAEGLWVLFFCVCGCVFVFFSASIPHFPCQPLLARETGRPEGALSSVELGFCEIHPGMKKNGLWLLSFNGIRHHTFHLGLLARARFGMHPSVFFVLDRSAAFPAAKETDWLDRERNWSNGSRRLIFCSRLINFVPGFFFCVWPALLHCCSAGWKNPLNNRGRTIKRIRWPWYYILLQAAYWFRSVTWMQVAVGGNIKKSINR